MPYEPVIVDSFGGLNLQADPLDVGLSGAVDLLNVDFDSLGRVRTRGGSAKFNSNTISSAGYQALFASPTNGGEIVAVRGQASGAIDKLVLAQTMSNLSAGTASTFPLASAALSTPTTTALYITFASTAGTGVTIQKYNGSTVAGGTGKPTHVATWPTSNRLVQGGYFAAADSPSAANGSRHTVFFSDAGAPDTYTANNFVTLRPGDGETITSIVSWRDLLFVFKASSMFVFYGESTDTDGNPVFNYRRVDLPEPVIDPMQFSAHGLPVVAGPDAVYFVTPRGIYRTAGDVPQPVSGPVHPIFSSDSVNVSSSVLASIGGQMTLAWAAGRLICTYTTAAAQVRQLAWDPETRAWTLWGLPSGAITNFPPGSALALVRDIFFFPSGNNIWQYAPTWPDDGGSAIAWSYTSGLYSPANDRGRVAISLESQVVGSGTVTLKVATTGGSGSSSGAFDTGSAVTLGTVPAVAEGWQQIDREGALWQHKLSGSGVASVSGLTHYLSFVKPSGVW